jgi:MFS family permease
MHVTSHVVAGVVGSLAFLAAAGMQLVFGRATTRTQLSGGLGLLVLGLVPVVVSLFVASLPLFFVGGVLAGGGVGMLFKGAVTTVAGLAEAGSRGEALAGLFLAAYIGLAIPVIALGLVVQSVPATFAVLGFAVLVAVVGAAVAPRLVRR